MHRRILIVTGRIDTTGGTEIYLRRLFEALATRGVSAWCLSGGRPRPEPHRHIIDARLHDDHPLHAGPPLLESVRALVRAEDFDAVYVANLRCPEILGLLARHPRSLCHVHDHRYGCPSGLRVLPRSGIRCDRRAGLPCLALCAWPAWLDHRFVPRWAKELAEFQECQRQARQFRHVLAASRSVRDALIADGFASEKVALLPCFVTGRDPQPTPLPTGPARAVFVGRVEHAKGADVFVRALGLLAHGSGIVVGDGAALPELRRLAASLGLAGRIQFTGALPNDEARSCMREAHVVVVPSRWPEPFGMVGIEAMAVGRAVIGSAVGGIPDWLADGRTGALVRPGDPAALAGAIERLTSDRKALAEMGEKAWQAAAGFLPDAHLDRFLELAGLGATP